MIERRMRRVARESLQRRDKRCVVCAIDRDGEDLVVPVGLPAREKEARDERGEKNEA
jgi:hypothetical protein